MNGIVERKRNMCKGQIIVAALVLSCGLAFGDSMASSFAVPEQ